MKRLLAILGVLWLIGIGIFWIVTIPQTSDVAVLDGIVPDVAQGQAVFTAAGCASCHAADGATGEAKLQLTGGRAFPSDFGTFYAPNISPDASAGIGSWDIGDFLNAVRHGTSPEGQHYYPAFPYAAYSRMTNQDVVSLFAYLQSLPPMTTDNKPHDVGFPFNIRRSLGGWKLLFMPRDWALKDADTPELKRGRYLVEAMSHCGECHTPRNVLGGLKMSKWLGGAANPSGDGRVPNITTGVLSWSDAEISAYFTSGFTPDFDSVGGHMVEVVENLMQMPADDVAAIVAYLKAVPAVP